VVSMATVISIATQKGGTGKSSTAINLACALSSSGYRVAVVDTDPQATFSKWQKKRVKKGISTFPVRNVPRGLLEEELAEMRTDPALDIILIDTPGNIEDITRAAVMVSDAVISPLRPSSMDMEHSVDTAKFIQEIRNTYPDILFLLFINSAMPRWKISQQIAETVRELLKKLPKTVILETQIPLAVAIAEFFGSGESIFEYAPKSTSATQYKRLTKEIVECLMTK
jgi:chromosome partitioning protein